MNETLRLYSGAHLHHTITEYARMTMDPIAKLTPNYIYVFVLLRTCISSEA